MKSIVCTSCLLLLTLSFSHVSAQPGWRWGVGMTGYGLPNVDAWDVANDHAGNVYTAGTIFSADSVHFGPFTIYDPGDSSKTFITKADSSGNFQWVIAAHDVAIPQAMAADSAGNVYLLVIYSSPMFRFGGVSLSQSTVDNMYALVKISPAGTVLWGVNVAPQTITTFAWYPRTDYYEGCIGLDGAGNIYVSGVCDRSSFTVGSTTFTNPVPGSVNGFVAKYDAAGSPVWARQIADKARFVLGGMAVSLVGTVYLAGEYMDTLTIGGTMLTDSLTALSDSLAYLIKLDSSGNTQWAHKNGQYNLKYTALAVDNEDRPFVAGYFRGNAVMGTATFTSPFTTGFNIFISRFDSSGNVQWADAAYDSAHRLQNIPYYLSYDQCGKVCMSGMLEYPVSSPGIIGTGHFLLFGTDTLHVPPTAMDPAFFAVYDTSGAYLLSTSLLSGGEDWIGVSADNMGNFYTAGDNVFTMIVGPDTLVPFTPGAETYYMAKFNYGAPCPPGVLSVGKEPAQKEGIQLYPNPATGSCTISDDGAFPSGATAELYDVQGRLIRRFALKGNEVTVSLTGITPGIYVCRLLSPQSGFLAMKKLVVY